VRYAIVAQQQPSAGRITQVCAATVTWIYTSATLCGTLEHPWSPSARSLSRCGAELHVKRPMHFSPESTPLQMGRHKLAYLGLLAALAADQQAHMI